MLQTLCFLLLAVDVLLSITTLLLLLRARPQSAPLPPPSEPAQTPDPIDEGFENIMRFSVRTAPKGGEFF